MEDQPREDQPALSLSEAGRLTSFCRRGLSPQGRARSIQPARVEGGGPFGRRLLPLPPRPPPPPKRPLGESHGQSRPALLPDGSASSALSPNPPLLHLHKKCPAGAGSRRERRAASPSVREEAAALRWGGEGECGKARAWPAGGGSPRPPGAVSRRLLAPLRGEVCEGGREEAVPLSAPSAKMRPPQLLLLVASAACLLGLAGGLFLFGDPESPSKRSNCKPIPASLSLCRGIEYPDMRLPNLLGHETLPEVLEQAGAWIPLVQKRCHPDTRKFLCSLFAPVCLADLDEPIEPCRSLCERVKDGCAPVMSAFGFPWPDMLDCGRFPQDNDLCIPLASSDHVLPTPREVPKVCDACKTKNEDDNEIVENLCKNDFALKIKVKEIAYINGDTKITPETKSKTIYKLNGVTERDLKKTVLWLRGGLQCTCDEMNDINAPYLVMGQRLAGELVITSVKRWQKGQRAFKRFSRSIRKLQC